MQPYDKEDLVKKFSVILSAVLILSILAWTPSVMAGKDKVELVYVEWSCATASTNVVKAVLQEKLGYDVEITPVSAAAMWQAMATGDVDGMTTAWLAGTNGH